MWHPPDAILVGHQHVTVPPGETIRPIEILDVTLNEIGAPAAAPGTQQGQIAGALLGHTSTSPFGSTSSRRGLASPVANGVAVKPVGTCGICPLYGRTSGRFVTIAPDLGGGRSAGCRAGRQFLLS